MTTYSEHVLPFRLREFDWEAEPDEVWICHLPSGQAPKMPPRRSEAMQRLDRGHDWSWRNGKFRLSAAGYKPEDVVRVWFVYGPEAVIHCDQPQPQEASYCCFCGEEI